jgi:hypothetical protein
VNSGSGMVFFVLEGVKLRALLPPRNDGRRLGKNMAANATIISPTMIFCFRFFAGRFVFRAGPFGFLFLTDFAMRYRDDEGSQPLVSPSFKKMWLQISVKNRLSETSISK